MEMHTSEPVVSVPSPFDAEIAIIKLKSIESPSSDQILAEVIQTTNEPLQPEKLINSIWRKEELFKQ
jgi:hypothetical protein